MLRGESSSVSRAGPARRTNPRAPSSFLLLQRMESPRDGPPAFVLDAYASLCAAFLRARRDGCAAAVLAAAERLGDGIATAWHL